jgi:protocatechuate 3,4-dioxygenase beta subunit
VRNESLFLWASVWYIGWMKQFFAISLLTAAALVFTPPISAAYEKVVDGVIKGDCTVTPEVKDMPFYPGKDIGRTNNLRRETGLAVVAKGEPIYIVGQVLDENCVPVSDVTVEMWQANGYGKYHHPDDKGDKLRDENFNGSGTTRTDNLGKFKFLTVFPGQAKVGSAPRVHFTLSHPELKGIITEMYFPEQAGNEDDTDLQANQDKYTALLATTNFEAKDGTYKVERFSGDVAYYFTITLKGKNKFRKY